MKTAVTTIQFNTGRKYTAEGQIITATLYSDGAVTFMDHSRMIDGEFSNQDSGLLSLPEYRLGGWELHLRGAVVSAYDKGKHESTKRSRADGMMKGGRNTREGYEVLAKLAKFRHPRSVVETFGQPGLTQLWADFCNVMGFEFVDANEVLATVAETKNGEVWRVVREWIMDYIIVWDGGEDEAAPQYRVDGDDKVELFTAETQAECRSFVAGYTRGGDWGGHSALRLIDAATGEILHTYDAPEAEEAEDDGVAAEYPDHLDADEREIIDALICAALERGFEVRVKGLTPFTTDYQLITQNVAATDEEHIVFRKVGDDVAAGWVFLVHGNAASEVIADATDNLLTGEILDAAQPIIERLEGEGK